MKKIFQSLNYKLDLLNEVNSEIYNLHRKKNKKKTVSFAPQVVNYNTSTIIPTKTNDVELPIEKQPKKTNQQQELEELRDKLVNSITLLYDTNEKLARLEKHVEQISKTGKINPTPSSALPTQKQEGIVIPNLKEFLNSASKALIDGDLYRSALILKYIMTSQCGKNMTNAPDCIQSEPLKIHMSTLLTIWSTLGGTQRIWDGIEEESSSSNSTSSSSSSSSGAGDTDGNDADSGNNIGICKDQSEEEKAARSIIVPVDPGDLIEFGSSDLVGASKEKKLILKRIIAPKQWKNILKERARILFYGSPGTGKTQITKAMVSLLRRQYSDINQQNAIQLFATTGATFKAKYVGETGKSINRWYCVAEKYALDTNINTAISILFIDEIENIASERGGPNDSGGTMQDSVNALLTAIEGVIEYKHVVTIAATNLPWSLDDAIRRRMQVQIHVDLAGNKDRKELIHKVLLSRIVGKPPTTPRFLPKDKEDSQEILNNIKDKREKYDAEVKAITKRLSFQRLVNSCWVMTGWKSDSREILIDKYMDLEFYDSVLKIEKQKEEAVLKIEAFIKDGDHHVIDGQGLQLYENLDSPIRTFGFSNSDIVNIINDFFDDYALNILGRTYKSDKDGNYCYYYCVEEGCRVCDDIDRENYKLNWEDFETDPDHVDSEFLVIVNKIITNKKPSVTTNNYSKLVYYDITGENPVEKERLREIHIANKAQK